MGFEKEALVTRSDRPRTLALFLTAAAAVLLGAFAAAWLATRPEGREQDPQTALNAPVPETQGTSAAPTPGTSSGPATSSSTVGAAPEPASNQPTSPATVPEAGATSRNPPSALPLGAPTQQTLRDDVRTDTHGTPKSLLAFAESLAGTMEAALQDAAKAKETFAQLSSCVQSEDARMATSARALCLSNAKRLAEKHPDALGASYSAMVKRAPAQIASLVETNRVRRPVENGGNGGNAPAEETRSQP